MKKLLCSVMCTAFLVSNQAMCFAQDFETTTYSGVNVEQTTLTKEVIENKINQLQSEFDLTYESLDNNTKNSSQVDIHFDTLEEYEAFIRELSEPKVLKVKSVESISNSDLVRSTKDSVRLEMEEVWLDTISRGYNPRVDLLYTWRYSNGNPIFDEILETYAWVSGINFGEWETHFISYDFFEDFARYDGIDLEVVGSITLSIGIGDFSFGHKIPADYIMTYSL